MDLIKNGRDDAKVMMAATCFAYGRFGDGDAWLMQYVLDVRKSLGMSLQNVLRPLPP